MPHLVLEDVPQELYDDLRQAAAAKQRTVTEEVLDRLRPMYRHLPDQPFLTEEISAPCTIPLSGVGKPIKTRQGAQHLPDPPWITAGDR